MYKDKKKIFIRSWGCQMNLYDADLIRDILASAGYSMTEHESEADIIFLHTCSVRELAEVKVFNKIDLLVREKRRSRTNLIIGITGCMAENKAAYIRKKYPEVNILCGPNSYLDLPALLDRAVDQGHGESLGLDKDVDYPYLNPDGNRLQAFVAIMRGCNNFCSYCVVPYVRGREVSRPADEIVAEVSALLEYGCKEITLLGQNVNSYGNGSGTGFVDLLETLNTLSGKFRIRFVTSHPKDAGEPLFRAIRDFDKVCPYVHLPMQSGSNKILGLMNRKYTREEYFSKIELLKSIVPEIALSSDFIVGFPGETEEDFQDTCDALRRVEYASAFIFKYSTRSGTKAASLPDDVPREIKEERNLILLDLQRKISLKRNKHYIGKTVEILVEGKSKRNPHTLCGRTPDFRNVVFEGDETLIGQFIPATVTRVTDLTLFGKRADD